MVLAASMEQIEEGALESREKQRRKRNCLEDVLAFAGREQGAQVDL